VWRLEGTRSQTIAEGFDGLTVDERQSMIEAAFDLDPSFFRATSTDITTMELSHALRYLKEIALIDSQRYPPLATDLVKRLFDALTPLILVFIAVTISYHYKKSVLLFSIITSLILAVIYYVVQMVTLIMARQGVIGPLWGMAIPVFVLVSIALLERAIIRGRA
jgi:lipopolysaccharide export system permease protein